jgi:hypothetical protein
MTTAHTPPTGGSPPVDPATVVTTLDEILAEPGADGPSLGSPDEAPGLVTELAMLEKILDELRGDGPPLGSPSQAPSLAAELVPTVKNILSSTGSGPAAGTIEPKPIYRVMDETADGGDAAFTFFSQAEYKWPGVRADARGGEGVCLALAMRWVAARGTTDYVTQFNDDHKSAHERTSVAALQNQQPDLTQRERYTREEMSRLKYSRIDSTLLSWPLLRIQRKLDFTAYLEEVGRAAVALEPDSGAILHIISPSGGSSNPHATATYRHAGGESVSFFDPNGGVLTFGTLAAGERWLREKLPTATANDYDKITSVRIERFRRV